MPLPAPAQAAVDAYITAENAHSAGVVEANAALTAINAKNAQRDVLYMEIYNMVYPNEFQIAALAAAKLVAHDAMIAALDAL